MCDICALICQHEKKGKKLQASNVSWCDLSWKRCSYTVSVSVHTNTPGILILCKTSSTEINLSGIVKFKLKFQIFAIWFCCCGCWMAAWKVQLVQGNKWVKMPCFFLSLGQTGCHYFPASTSLCCFTFTCITPSCLLATVALSCVTCSASVCHQCHPLWQPPHPPPDLFPAATLGSSHSLVSYTSKKVGGNLSVCRLCLLLQN